MLELRHLFQSKVIVIPIILGSFLTGSFAIFDSGAIPLTTFQLSLVISGVLFVGRMLLLNNIKLADYGLFVLYVALFSIIVISIIYTPERQQALFNTVRFGVLIVMTYLIYNSIQSKSDIVFVCLAIIVISSLVSLFNLIQVYNNPEILTLNYLSEGRKLIRASTFESDPNRFASTFIMSSMLLFSFLLSSKDKLLKLLLAALLALILGSILISYSRSTWVAVFFGFSYIVFTTKRFDIILYAFLAGFILIILSDTFYTLFLSIIDRIIDIFAGKSDDSSNIRIMLLIGAIKMTFDSYFLGVGFEGFSTKFQEYYTVQESIGVYDPHNIYYAVLAELGIVGLIIFISILIIYLKTALNNATLANSESSLTSINLAFSSSLIAYFVFYLFYSGMLVNSQFFILVGLIFSMKKILSERKFTTVSALQKL